MHGRRTPRGHNADQVPGRPVVLRREVIQCALSPPANFSLWSRNRLSTGPLVEDSERTPLTRAREGCCCTARRVILWSCEL